MVQYYIEYCGIPTVRVNVQAHWYKTVQATSFQTSVQFSSHCSLICLFLADRRGTKMWSSSVMRLCLSDQCVLHSEMQFHAKLLQKKKCYL